MPASLWLAHGQAEDGPASLTDGRREELEKETPQQYTRRLLGYLGGKDSLRVMVETPRRLALLFHLIQRALKRCGGNVSEAARALGLSRSALYRRLQHYGL